MSVQVRAVDSFDDVEGALQRYLTVDAAAFGLAADPAVAAAKRPLIDPGRYLLAHIDDEPVGGAGSYATELTLPGGAIVDVAAVSDVGVAPTHRRRGVVSELMRTQLRGLLDDGTPLAVLHASEAGIYRRFGYGPSTRWRQVRIDARRVVFREDVPRAGGTLHVLQRADAVAECSAVHDRVRRTVTGGLARPDTWWPAVVGDVDTYLGGTAGHLAMVHRDGRGTPDGYALYKVDHDWEAGQANHSVQVWELVGQSPEVELALWRALIEHDLVRVVSGPIQVDHPLFDVVVDGRQVGAQWDQDLLWARPLDVVELLSTRRYGVAGRIVLDVADPFLVGPGGTYELRIDGDGVGECRRSDATPMIRVGIDGLGAVLLGGGSFRRLARAGQVSAGESSDLALADAAFACDPLPWCWVRF